MRAVISLFFVTLLLAQPAWAEPSAGTVKYNRQDDTLTLAVEQVSLKELLGKIAIQSQLEVLFDERADRPVSMEFEGRSLEEGLKNLLGMTNYAFRYTEKDEGGLLLVGVRVLPQGSSDGAMARPLLQPAGEAFMNARHNYPVPQQESALFNKRWQARLAEMPPEVRKMVTERAQQRIDELARDKAERQARHEEKKAEREARKAEQRAKRGRAVVHPQEMTLEERTQHEQRLRNIQQMLDSEQ